MSEELYGTIADQHARRVGIDPGLFRRLIAQESAWNPNAQSPVGAFGLTQAMPATASDPGFGVTPVNLNDPNDQIRFGADYFKAMMDATGGDTNKALAAYNWGIGNAQDWNGNLATLPKETRDYILKINGGDWGVPMDTPMGSPALDQEMDATVPAEEQPAPRTPAVSPMLAQQMLASSPPLPNTPMLTPPVIPNDASVPPAYRRTSSDGAVGGPIPVIPPTAPVLQDEASVVPPTSFQLTGGNIQGPAGGPAPFEGYGALTEVPVDQAPQFPAAVDPSISTKKAPVNGSSGVPARIPPGGSSDPATGGLRERVNAFLGQDRNRQGLLAIGAGLLSGNDWSSGFGAAANNLMATDQTIRDREEDRALLAQRGAQAERLQQMRLAAAREAASRGTVYNRPFNVVGRDPETGQEVVTSGTMVNGVPHIQGPHGLVPAHEALNDSRIGGRGEAQDVQTGAGGIPNAVFISEGGVPTFNFQREGEQKTYGYAMRAIGAERDLSRMMETFGTETFTSVEAGLRQWASQNARSSITGAALNDILDDAGIQGAARSSMAAYLQAVLRADTGAAYTGTEIADYAGAFLPNPGDDPLALEQKQRLRRRELFTLAGRAGAAAPYLSGMIDGQYEIPGGYWEPPALDQSNGEIDDILDGYGL